MGQKNKNRATTEIAVVVAADCTLELQKRIVEKLKTINSNQTKTQPMAQKDRTQVVRAMTSPFVEKKMIRAIKHTRSAG